MATMSLDNELKKFWPLLGSEEKESVISQIKYLLRSKEEHVPMAKEEYLVQYNKDIDQANEDIKTGAVISQEDLEKESESW